VETQTVKTSVSPILFDHKSSEQQSMKAFERSDRGEVIVKIDDRDFSGKKDAVNPINMNSSSNNNNKSSKIWRVPSCYDFLKEDDDDNKNNNVNNGGLDFMPRGQRVEDPPSKLIGQFLHKQRASGEISLDMDLEMDELHNLPPSVDEEGHRNQQRQSPPQQAQECGRASGSGALGGEVVRCTSNESFQRKSSLLRAKTRSRLMDPPDEPDKRSGRVPNSGQLRSGMLAKALDDDEDDPFSEDDLPEEYKKTCLSAATVLEFVTLVLIIAALVCSLSIPYLRNKNLWKLMLWKWEVLVLVLFCGRLVAWWGIRIIVFIIERNFLLRKRVLYFVYGVRKVVRNCLWLGLVLIAWHFLFDKKVEREAKTDKLGYVTKFLVALLVGTLVWLVKTLTVKVLASSFHVSTYFDRIQDSLFNQCVIVTLSGRPLFEMRNAEEEEIKLADEVRKLQNAGATIPPDLKASAFPSMTSGRVIGSGGLQKSPRVKRGKLSRASSKKGDDQGITIDHLHKLHTKNVSAWHMKRSMNIIRYGTLSTLDDQILDTTNKDETNTQIRSESDAKTAAKKIFLNVARQGSK
jgi:hypothetical protein